MQVSPFVSRGNVTHFIAELEVRKPSFPKEQLNLACHEINALPKKFPNSRKNNQNQQQSLNPNEHVQLTREGLFYRLMAQSALGKFGRRRSTHSGPQKQVGFTDPPPPDPRPALVKGE